MIDDGDDGIIPARRSFGTADEFKSQGLDARMRSTLQALANIRKIGTSPEDRENRIAAAIAEVEGHNFTEKYTIDELCKEAGEVLQEKWDEDMGRTPSGGIGGRR